MPGEWSKLALYYPIAHTLCSGDLPLYFSWTVIKITTAIWKVVAKYRIRIPSVLGIGLATFHVTTTNLSPYSREGTK